MAQIVGQPSHNKLQSVFVKWLSRKLRKVQKQENYVVMEQAGKAVPVLPVVKDTLNRSSSSIIDISPHSLLPLGCESDFVQEDTAEHWAANLAAPPVTDVAISRTPEEHSLISANNSQAGMECSKVSSVGSASQLDTCATLFSTQTDDIFSPSTRPNNVIDTLAWHIDGQQHLRTLSFLQPDSSSHHVVLRTLSKTVAAVSSVDTETDGLDPTKVDGFSIVPSFKTAQLTPASASGSWAKLPALVKSLAESQNSGAPAVDKNAHTGSSSRQRSISLIAAAFSPYRPDFWARRSPSSMQNCSFSGMAQQVQ